MAEGGNAQRGLAARVSPIAIFGITNRAPKILNYFQTLVMVTGHYLGAVATLWINK